MMKDMTLTIEEAKQFFSDFYFGAHHIPSKIKPCGEGWEVLHFATLSSYDYNHLTRLVLMAHDRAIRVEIAPCNMQHIRIKLHKRDHNSQDAWSRHPTIEQAIKWITEHPRDKALTDTTGGEPLNPEQVEI